MIHPDDQGRQAWNGVHVTHRTTVEELFNIDNVGPNGKLLTGFDMFRQAGESLDEIIRQARDAEKRVLAIGSGWALSKINITDGWLVNTKLLNGCYDVGEPYFDDRYPAAERRCVVLAQAGMQIAELNAFLELAPREVSEQALDQGCRDRQRPDDRRRRVRQHARLAAQLRGNAGLRRRPAPRHRQWTDAVDREGIQARAHRGVR